MAYDAQEVETRWQKAWAGAGAFEVEIDLSKFMELLQEKADLKDRIRELEDEGTKNPHQKWIFLAMSLSQLSLGILQDIRCL